MIPLSCGSSGEGDLLRLFLGVCVFAFEGVSGRLASCLERGVAAWRGLWWRRLSLLEAFAAARRLTRRETYATRGSEAEALSESEASSSVTWEESELSSSLESSLVRRALEYGLFEWRAGRVVGGRDLRLGLRRFTGWCGGGWAAARVWTIVTVDLRIRLRQKLP